MKKTVFVLFSALIMVGCAYHYFTGGISPQPQPSQLAKMEVRDDGSVAYVHKRLEVSLRPVSDEELNRKFAQASDEGVKSTNPYTYGNWEDPVTDHTPKRFTVFELKVKNYTYPKIKIDPAKIKIVAGNGREYSSLSMTELLEYYYPYIVGYSGVAYNRFEERKDILKSSLYSGDVIFSGQKSKGYVVFPKLHHDVKKFAVEINDLVLRFNVYNEPSETKDLTFYFQREVYKAMKPHK